MRLLRSQDAQYEEHFSGAR